MYAHNILGYVKIEYKHMLCNYSKNENYIKNKMASRNKPFFEIGGMKKILVTTLNVPSLPLLRNQIKKS